MSGFPPPESWARWRKTNGFTMIEILVVFGIVAVLVTLVIRIAPAAFERARETASMNNLRHIGAGYVLYVGDHDGSLPQRVTTNGWPSLLNDYLRNTKIFADSSDPENYLTTQEDPLDDNANRTSYILNSFNHFASTNDPGLTPPDKFMGIAKKSQLVLASLRQQGTTNFYVEETPSQRINRTAYRNGSNYLFTDGTVKHLMSADSSDSLWKLNSD